MFPVVPLAAGQALSVGLTSYDGGVFFGLNHARIVIKRGRVAHEYHE